jgi:hypothetical protein
MLNVALSENGSKYGVQNLSAYVIQDSQRTKVNCFSHFKLTKTLACYSSKLCLTGAILVQNCLAI